VHVCLARLPGGRHLTPARLGRRPFLTLPLLLLALSMAWPAAACRRPVATSDITFEWTLVPMPPVVGQTILRLRLLDRARRPVLGAKLRVEGHMTHPGMAPVLASASEREGGLYEAALHFTMPGDWILMVGGTLASGAAVDRRIDVAGVRSSG